MSNTCPSSQLESLLGLLLPADYKDFIDTAGYLYLNNIGIEIYGFKPGFDTEKIPCVVAATKLYGEDCDLDKDEIVISHTGLEGRIVVLNTKTSHVFETGFPGTKDKIAGSFSSWLQSMQVENNS